MRQTLLIGFLAVTFFSGNNIQSKEQPSAVNKTTGLKEQNLDTLKVNGQSVVFFTVSQPEYDTLVKDPNSGIDEILGDFNYYAESVNDTIERLGYKSVMTASRYVQVKLDNGICKTYDRLADKESVTGYILSDGKKEPRIEYGVSTDVDFLIVFDEFYKK